MTFAQNTKWIACNNKGWLCVCVCVCSALSSAPVGQQLHCRQMCVSPAPSGYYTHISTLADVQENVMEYLHVLSRPMVINHDHDIIWTEAYMDTVVRRADRSQPISLPNPKRWNFVFERASGGVTLMVTLMVTIIVTIIMVIVCLFSPCFTSFPIILWG